VSKLRTIPQDAIGFMGGHCFVLCWLEGFRGFEPRIVMFKVKGRLSLVKTLRWKGAGHAPSLHVIP
jgi:hypothetical protein